jgi:choline-glycine betaine transporter
MDFMSRNARWIALAAVLALTAPFLAWGLNALFAVDTFLVAVILLVAVVVSVVLLARSQNDEE